MTYQEGVTYIKETLSGGNKVNIEVEDTAIRSFFNEAFVKCKPWFLEPVTMETLAVVPAGDGSYYIPLTSFSKQPEAVEKVWPTSQTGMGSFDNDVAGLLSLEGRHIISQNMVASSAAISFERQADSVLNTTLTFSLYSDKLFISGAVIDTSATVSFHPKALSFELTTFDKAISWMLDYALAKTQIALGRVRGKFRGSDLDIDNDAQDHLQEGNSSIITLMSQLESMYL